jgi:arsenate reductase-like glutaredoxin family protein
MIIFASMKGCGFCEKAMKELENEITEGSVKVVDASEAKEHGMNGNGFPQFKSKVTGKSTMGFRSKDKLMNDLGHGGDGVGSPPSNGNGKIKFYHMEGCGFCKKAMEMLRELIERGVIEVVPHTEAPADVRGFPHFMASNGKSHTGLPKSPEELMSKLGDSCPVEHYRPMRGMQRRVAPQYVERFHHNGMHMGMMRGRPGI